MMAPAARDASGLRPYQRECLDAIRSAHRQGTRRQLVCLPTGTGKTVVFSQLPRFFAMKHRMLVLAHREERRPTASSTRNAATSSPSSIEAAGGGSSPRRGADVAHVA